ncbi:MAG: prepilin-type N-terminal cleavage/methylation domain-containing protein [Deltaproteobacteria bacterium]|nr:MAG: prepilin-type N-terminal cleavage/methylation domain-containing protein [Deltaproteobacteria bacterium]
MNVLRNREGFTLLELLIAVVLSVILMAAIYSTYYSQQKSYLVQEQVAAMQQNLRAAMFYMEREIRIAGCDPTRKAGADITTASVNSLRFTADTDGDEALTTITYSLYTGADGIQKLGRDTGGGNVAVADYIEVLNFVYLDQDGAMLDDGGGNVTVADNIAKIRSIQVTVVARAGREDHTYTDTSDYYNQHDLVNPILAAPNDHYRRMLLSTNIKCRNLGL